MLSDVCLSDVCRVLPVGGWHVWHVLADWARLGWRGSRLPLSASVAGLGGGISWRPPTYSSLKVDIPPGHCWLGNRKDIQPEKIGVCLLVATFDWSFARLIAPIVATTSITLSSNKIQNEDILVPANPSPPGKWPLKRRQTVLIKS